MAKEKKPRLRAKVTVDGKAVYITAHSKQELEQKKVESREHLRDGVDLRRDVPFVKLLKEWWENDRKPQIKAVNTLRNNLNVLDNHLLPHLDDRQMARAVTRTDLQRCMDAQAGKSKSIIDCCAMMLEKTCKTALADRRLLFDPSAGLRKPEAKELKKRGALTDTQVDKLMDVAAEADHDGLMIYLLYFLGLRRAEMLGLKWGDFDWDAGMVSIERQVIFRTKAGEKDTLAGLKTSNGYRRVPIPEQLEEILMPYRQMPSMLIFHREENQPISYGEYQRTWHALMAACGFAHATPESRKKAEKAGVVVDERLPFRQKGISYDYDISAHWFRHNYITMMFDAGVPAETASRLVGHSKYSTTFDTYTHIKEERLKAESVKLEGMFTKKVARRLPRENKQA